MERKKGSFILNDTRTVWSGRAVAIHVLADATFTAIRDTRNQSASYYLSATGESVKPGAVIAARDGAQFVAVSVSAGSVEIIF